MSHKFEVEHVILSDYFSQDTSGKHVFAGVYGSELVFSAAPIIWPLLIFSISIKLFESKFEGQLSLLNPDKKPAAVYEISFNAAGKPNQFVRASISVQLPMMKFSGPGIYMVEIGEVGKRPHYKKPINVIVGTSPVVPTGSVTVGLKFVDSPFTV